MYGNWLQEKQKWSSVNSQNNWYTFSTIKRFLTPSALRIRQQVNWTKWNAWRPSLPELSFKSSQKFQMCKYLTEIAIAGCLEQGACGRGGGGDGGGGLKGGG